jgi:hypothetical protein
MLHICDIYITYSTDATILICSPFPLILVEHPLHTSPWSFRFGNLNRLSQLYGGAMNLKFLPSPD